MSIQFGQYAILDNVRYHLEREPEMWWEFKPPTAREEVAINRFTQGGSVKTSMAGIERKIVTDAEIAAEELALTFADSNFEDENGKALFQPGMKLDALKALIETFPRELFFELWRALGDACPGWGSLPVKKKEDEEEEEVEKAKDAKTDKKDAEVGSKKM